MKTYSLKPKEISRAWYILDAAEIPLGRLSSEAAKLLIGKNKPSFTPHIDGGDNVVIINAERLIVTGAKGQDKVYYRHSGYPGGLHKRSLNQQMTKDPQKVIYKSIRGMLPVNKLRAGRLKRLKIYGGGEHHHAAQSPVVVKLISKKKARDAS